MGCICSKGASANEYVHKHHDGQDERSFRGDKHVGENKAGGNDEKTRQNSAVVVEDHEGSALPIGKNGHKIPLVHERRTMSQIQKQSAKDNSKQSRDELKKSRVASVPNGAEIVHIDAGWPSWLTDVAAEATIGWVPRRADSFAKLEKIGQGTYSSVYKARDLESGKMVAMKKIRFINMDPESVRFMAREINILRKLNHPNVMKLECLVTSRVSGSIYLVFEYMEHDLAGLAARPGVKFTESQIKCYMKQLFQGLDYCHSLGVLHRDIKGSNLLIDHNGNLKIGDFGLATFFKHNRKQPLTVRVVTLWYRPPELLLGATNYGAAVDLWSAGCILAELFHGKPIMSGRTEVEQLHKIFKLCGSPSEEYWKESRLSHATTFRPRHLYGRSVNERFKDFPSSTLALLDVLLAVEPEYRGSASSALESEFFLTKPLPCHPSTLPKYPPSKEFDARQQDEAARQKAAKGLAREHARKNGRQSRAIPVVDASGDIEVSIQRNLRLPNGKSNNGKFRGQDVSRSHQLIATSSMNDSKSQKSFNGQKFSALSRLATADAKKQNDANDLSDLVNDPKFSSKEDGDLCNKTFATVNAGVERIHCSGPLLASEGKMDDVLRQHEMKIQGTVLKARVDKAMSRRTFTHKRQIETVFEHGMAR